MISVCMATYNGALFVAEQLDSILEQIGANDEVVVVDDNSTDNTAAVVLSRHDSRVHLFVNPQNIGPIQSFERALSLSKGKIIFFSDQDDVWQHNKVRVVLRCFANGADLVIHDSSVVNSDLELVNSSWNSYNHNKFKGFWHTLLKNPFTGANMAISRQLLQRCLPFPREIVMHDWWIGLVAYRTRANVCVVTEPLIQYRRHGNNVTGGKTTLRSKIRNRVSMIVALRGSSVR